MNAIKSNAILKSKINEKNPNVFKILENHNLAINAAKEIGLHIINIGANDLSSGNVYMFSLIINLAKINLSNIVASCEI